MKSLVVRVSSTNHSISELRNNFLQAWEDIARQLERSWWAAKCDSGSFEYRFEDIDHLSELHTCLKCKLAAEIEKTQCMDDSGYTECSEYVESNVCEKQRDYK